MNKQELLALRCTRAARANPSGSDKKGDTEEVKQDKSRKGFQMLLARYLMITPPFHIKTCPSLAQALLPWLPTLATVQKVPS